MLVLSRKENERIRIRDSRTGEEIWITIVRQGGGEVRIGIAAPPEFDIEREEIIGRPKTTT